MKRIALILLSLIAITYLGLSYIFSSKILQTNSSFQNTLNDIENYWGTSYEEMIALLPPPSDFTVQSVDEIEIRGKYFNVSDTSSCLFIFSHGWARSWENMLKYYPIVDDCNCDIIMYDHRAHGKSGGEFPTGGIMEAKDLISVTKWAEENKQYSWSQIAWVGSSWGAGAALIAGAKDQNPAFIVADSPYQDWYSAIFERAIEDYGFWINGIAPAVMFWVNIRADVDYKRASPMIAAESITEPVFLVHSQADPKTNSAQSVNIAKRLNSSSEFHHTQWGNIHVMDVINNKEDLKILLRNFIDKNALESFIPDTISIDAISKK